LADVRPVSLQDLSLGNNFNQSTLVGTPAEAIPRKHLVPAHLGSSLAGRLASAVIRTGIQPAHPGSCLAEHPRSCLAEGLAAGIILVLFQAGIVRQIPIVVTMQYFKLSEGLGGRLNFGRRNS